MIIRHATTADIEKVMPIYDIGRAYMRANGDTQQWINGYPSKETILNDIANGDSYVCEEDGEMVGVFSFIIGVDHTYLYIEDGAWRSDETYGTIHRIASTGKVPGLAAKCFDYCREKCGYLRVDTHETNNVMRNAVERYGFKYCGIIYIDDGSARFAYDYIYEEIK